MMSSVLLPLRDKLGRVQWWSAVVGVVAMVVCGVGAWFSPTQFFRTYLAAYLFFLGIAHGCLAILMLYHLTGGGWGFLIRRILEAGVRTLPLLAILFLPLLFGLDSLYLWAQPDTVASSKGLQHKAIYLNVPFFLGRAVIYFLSWLGLAYFLITWSRKEDQTGDPQVTEKLIRLSGPGLIIYGITITFASVDWVMSLQPAFHSSIFGPVFASGELLTGFAFALVVLASLSTRPPLASVLSAETLNDLGNLLFTFLIIWAYMIFFQFMLIWIANLSSDVIWYLPRSRGGWRWVVWCLVILHFTVPFFLLLSRDVKRNPRSLAVLATLILCMHLVYLNYQVLPAFPDSAFLDNWMCLLTPLGIGGVCLTVFLHGLQTSSLLPQHDLNETVAVQRSLEREQQPGGEGSHG